MISKEELLTKLQILKQVHDELGATCALYAQDFSANSPLDEATARTIASIFRKIGEDSFAHHKVLEEIEGQVKAAAKNVF